MQQLENLTPKHTLSYGTWAMACVPLMVINLILAWIWIQIFYWLKTRNFSHQKPEAVEKPDVDEDRESELSPRQRNHETSKSTLDESGDLILEETKDVATVIKEEYNSLGSIKRDEVIVFVLFLLLVCLWVTRDPKMGFKGWAEFFPRLDGVRLLFLCLRNVLFNTFFHRLQLDLPPRP